MKLGSCDNSIYNAVEHAEAMSGLVNRSMKKHFEAKRNAGFETREMKPFNEDIVDSEYETLVGK